MRRTKLRFITVFGLGGMRPFPGTWGSLPPVVVAAIMLAAGLGPDAAGAWAWTPWLIYHGVLIVVMKVFALACLFDGDWAEARYGRKDPSNVVADETAGQCLALMFLPPAALATPVLAAFTLLYAFLAFRLMDIIKPPPARQLQAVPGGWGILLDDLVAGAFALGLVQLIARVIL